MMCSLSGPRGRVLGNRRNLLAVKRLKRRNNTDIYVPLMMKLEDGVRDEATMIDWRKPAGQGLRPDNICCPVPTGLQRSLWMPLLSASISSGV